MTPPAKRHAYVPPHIDPGKLPDNVYYSRKGRGRWVYRKRQGGKRGTEIRLGDASIRLADIWQAVDRLLADHTSNFRGISTAFQQSPTWLALARATQTDYGSCHRAIVERVTRSGDKLGDVPMAAWTPGAVRRYMDARGVESKACANHELRYMRRVFSWAHERDMIDGNPARGVKQFETPPRQHYVTDGEYQFVLQMAAKSGSPHIANIMELAYLCRMRLAEVLDIQQHQITEAGLLVVRRKGSKNNLVAWNARLHKAVGGVTRHSTIWLFAGTDGDRMRETSVQTAWQRLIHRAVAQGLKERFTLHDLKRKGVSDTKGDKLAASGHRSPAMLRVYDVLPAEVKTADFGRSGRKGGRKSGDS